MVSRIRITHVYNTARLICLLLVIVGAGIVSAQGSSRNVQIELVAETPEGEALVHVRIPRGQSVEEAVLSQGEYRIVLDRDVIQLPLTQFIILDASDEMVNLQSVVQSNVPRLWRTGEHPTSLIFYNSEVDFQEPTNDAAFLDSRLADYSINPGEPACLGEALTSINDRTRNFERSWRILLVTVGDFSRQASCDIQDLATAPTLVDVIAITGSIDPALQDLIDRSGGQFYNANLRSVEARLNEVLTQWGQPSYALRGAIPEGWDRDAPFELDISISNGTQESVMLSFRDYNVPLPPTATPQPSPTEEIPTEDLIIEETEASDEVAVAPLATAMPTQVPSSATGDSSGSNGVAILLIVGAVLFVIGAVVLALALSRVQRAPMDDAPGTTQNFYETLDSAYSDPDNSVTATRIRERGIVNRDDDPVTQIAAMDDTYMAGDVDDENDELLLTQVLTDDRFQNMMQQSLSNDEIVGWMRLIVEGGGESYDFELTRRGAVIGRSQECDIQITGDNAISRQHARLDVRSTGQVTISRLSTVNPVVVGGVRIGNRHPLEPNDVIHLSDETRLIFIAKQDEPDEHPETES